MRSDTDGLVSPNDPFMTLWLSYCDVKAERSAALERVAELEGAGRTLQAYIESRPQDAFYEVKNRPASIDAALRVFRKALGPREW